MTSKPEVSSRALSVLTPASFFPPAHRKVSCQLCRKTARLHPRSSRGLEDQRVQTCSLVGALIFIPPRSDGNLRIKMRGNGVCRARHNILIANKALEWWAKHFNCLQRMERKNSNSRSFSFLFFFSVHFCRFLRDIWRRANQSRSAQQRQTNRLQWNPVKMNEFTYLVQVIYLQGWQRSRSPLRAVGPFNLESKLEPCSHSAWRKKISRKRL